MGEIRKPKLNEMAAVKRLLDQASKNHAVLQRPLIELFESVRDFYIYADDKGVGGCCALHIDLEDLAEIRSLVVRDDVRGTGVGRQLIEACVAEAKMLGVSRVYALTRSELFFEKCGFAEIEKQELPHKVFNDCVRCPMFPDCDETAMIMAV